MNNNLNENIIEAGLDEVARGCLFGRVYAAVVIWNENIKENEIKYPNLTNNKLQIKDSKKLNREQRNKLKIYIEKNAVEFAIGWASVEEIDKINIRNATFLAMHRALDKLKVTPLHLIVDGNYFKPYKEIQHTCIIKGDDKYKSIAAASILAKVYHDNYIIELINEEPDLEKYGLINNMGYGTKKHIEAIIKYGITKHHRKTFGICKKYVS
jgi:ribonuclease HII